jgi:5'-3' exonuclease
MEKRLFIIDGHAHIYAGYFAPMSQRLTSPSGEPTKATAEEGRRLMEEGLEASVTYITQTFARIEEIQRRLGAG